MTIRVYCGTYHKYNCGSLAGQWIDLDQFDSAEEFYAYCRELHKDERDPEFMFQDYEGPKHFYCESYISEKIWDVLDVVDEDEVELFAEYLAHLGWQLNEIDVDEMHGRFKDDYIGEFDSLRDFGEHMAEMYGVYSEIPEHLHDYFDEEKYGANESHNTFEIDLKVWYNDIGFPITETHYFHNR